MLRKFAVALIATTMLAAPVLAADAVNTKPAPAANAAGGSKAATDAKGLQTSTPVSGGKTVMDKGAAGAKTTVKPATAPAANAGSKTVGEGKAVVKPAPAAKPAAESKPLSAVVPVQTKPAKIMKKSRHHRRYAMHRHYRHYAHHRSYRHLQVVGRGGNAGCLMAVPSSRTEPMISKTRVKHVKVIKAQKNIKRLVKSKKTIVNNRAALS